MSRFPLALGSPRTARTASSRVVSCNTADNLESCLVVKGNGPDTDCRIQYTNTSHSGRSPPGPWTTRCGSSSVVANTQDSQYIAGQWNPLKHGGRAAHDVSKARAAEPPQLRMNRRSFSLVSLQAQCVTTQYARAYGTDGFSTPFVRFHRLWPTVE